MSLFKQRQFPNGLLYICFAELWERFIFYGTLTFLLLYLIEALHFSEKGAYSFWGLFIALAYLAPFVGGYCADKYVGFYKGTMIGGYILALGCLLLAVTKSEQMFFVGIAILLLGFGFYKSNLVNLVGTLFTEASPDKDQAYTFFFMWMASGAILGPIVFGLMTKYIGWHAGFWACFFGIISSLVLLQLKKHRIDFKSLPVVANLPKNKASLLYASLVVLIVLFYGLIRYYATTNLLIGLFSLALFLLLVIRTMKSSTEARRKVVALMILIATTIVYYSAGLQIDGSLLLLIKQHIQHSIFGWTIPVTFFSSLEGVFVLVISPVVMSIMAKASAHNKEWSSYSKVGLGLIFAAVSFILFGVSAKFASVWLLPVLLIVIGTAFLGLADIFEIPIVMSTVSRYAPEKLQGGMMSLVLMSNAVAGYVGSKMGSLTAGQHTLNTHQGHEYAIVFLIFAVICLFFASLLFLFKKFGTAFLKEKNAI